MVQSAQSILGSNITPYTIYSPPGKSENNCFHAKHTELSKNAPKYLVGKVLRTLSADTQRERDVLTVTVACATPGAVLLYLLAVVGGVGSAGQVVVGPAVQVVVLSADDAVAGEAHAALALVHGLDGVAEEDALGEAVAAVAVVLTGVVWLTQLQGTDTGTGSESAGNASLSLDHLAGRRREEYREKGVEFRKMRRVIIIKEREREIKRGSKKERGQREASAALTCLWLLADSTPMP